MIDFCPKTRRPIVLITALNGSGKTTILTAIQIVLYGKLAPVVRTSKMGYKQYLKNKINNSTNDETSLELDIAFYQNGKRHTYSVNRCWRNNDNQSDINESFSVKVNNSEEKAVTEKWIEFIEGILPLNIMPLYFFDGEKVEEMASIENSSSMLATGILSLLGMDIVNKLQQDLKIYENRYILKDSKNLPDPFVIKEYHENVISLQTELKRKIQERALYQAKLEQAKGKLEKFEREFLKSGGDLYNRKEELYLKKERIRKQLIEYNEIKNQIMTKEGPFLLVGDLLSSIIKQAKDEMAGNEAEIAGKYLERQQKELIALLDNSLTGEIIEKINRYFKEKKKKFLKNSRITYYLNISHSTFAELIHLQKEIIPNAEKILMQTVNTIKDLEKENKTITELIHGLPADTEIQPLMLEIEKYKKRVAEYSVMISEYDERIKIYQLHLTGAAKKLKELITERKNDTLHNEKSKRILQYSQLVREFLTKFKETVTVHYITTLEKQIKKCFLKLLHKKGFIKSIKIDSLTFQLSLVDRNGKTIVPENLSAGERQLLMTAIFWALTIESGIEAPIIIDTPLGRLDSVHRKKIVENFFPNVGKQVILLSTDQEITDNFITYLRPCISCHYTIDNNQDTFVSEFRKIS